MDKLLKVLGGLALVVLAATLIVFAMLGMMTHVLQESGDLKCVLVKKA